MVIGLLVPKYFPIDTIIAAKQYSYLYQLEGFWNQLFFWLEVEVCKQRDLLLEPNVFRIMAK